MVSPMRETQQSRPCEALAMEHLWQDSTYPNEQRCIVTGCDATRPDGLGDTADHLRR